MAIINDHNRHLFDLMKFELDLFNNKKINLMSLIDNLESLYRRLLPFDPKWEKDFFDSWLDLESVYSDMLNNNKSELKPEDMKIVNDAINNISLLISKCYDEYIKFSDPSVQYEAVLLENSWLLCPKCIDAWETTSLDPMIICPKCNTALHNPKYKQNR